MGVSLRKRLGQPLLRRPSCCLVLGFELESSILSVFNASVAADDPSSASWTCKLEYSREFTNKVHLH